MHRAIEQGFDAFLIGNIANSALLEMREIAEVPVLDLGELYIFVMQTMDERLGFITINERYRPRLGDTIQH